MGFCYSPAQNSIKMNTSHPGPCPAAPGVLRTSLPRYSTIHGFPLNAFMTSISFSTSFIISGACSSRKANRLRQCVVSLFGPRGSSERVRYTWAYPPMGVKDFVNHVLFTRPGNQPTFTEILFDNNSMIAHAYSFPRPQCPLHWSRRIDRRCSRTAIISLRGSTSSPRRHL